MPFIGSQPAETALTTGDLADDIVTEAKIANDAIGLTELKAGTDGELISWDASGNPAAVAVGTATHVLTSNGAGAAPTFQAATGMQSIQVFTSTGTWTKPSGITKVKVICTGAGGGGGGEPSGSGNNQSQGGAAGGTAIELIDVSGTSSETVTIGAAGAAGSSGAGGTGGTSSFGSLCSATGGGGGAVDTLNQNSTVGEGSGGDININGGAGGGGGDGTTGRSGGMGGPSYWGGGAAHRSGQSEANPGSPGQAYGSGGSGGATDSQGGGAGKIGVIYVEEYA